MFEVKQVIEGKIFIHHRRDEMLSVFHQHEVPRDIQNVLSMLKILPDILSKTMLNQQIRVWVVYIKKNSTHQIIAMLK